MSSKRIFINNNSRSRKYQRKDSSPSILEDAFNRNPNYQRVFNHFVSGKKTVSEVIDSTVLHIEESEPKDPQNREIAEMTLLAVLDELIEKGENKKSAPRNGNENA